jgi:hypothetical protein
LGRKFVVMDSNPEALTIMGERLGRYLS